MERKLIQISDFNRICRVCMNNKKPIMVSVFDVLLSELISYSDLLKECTSISISVDDMLPKQLCMDCSKQLELSYKLKVQCLYSEQLMNDLIKNASTRSNEFDNDNLFDNENTKQNFDDDSTGVDIKDENNIKNEIIDECTNKTTSPTNLENKYKCIQCNVFFSKNTIVNHVEGDHKKSIQFCEHCDQIFWSASGFKQHIEKLNSKIETIDIKRHFENIQNESREKEYACKYCSEIFQIKQDLITHVKDIHKKTRKYIDLCKLCNEISWSTREKRKHYLIQHKQCFSCFKENIKNFKELKEHFKLQDHPKGRKISAPKGCLCAYCGKTLNNNSHYKAHLRTHTGEKPYSCDICGKNFSLWYSLHCHKVTHTQEKNFKCKICDRSFPFSASLRRHILCHSDERNFPCDLCDKRFKCRRELTRHKEIHTGERKYSCTICKKTFIRSSHLKVHLRTHDGVKPFACTICTKAYTRKYILENHMKSHK